MTVVTYNGTNRVYAKDRLEYPSPTDIRNARHQTGLTMQEAADLVYTTRNTWLRWEREPDHPQHSKMHPAFAELFALKTGLKPLPKITQEIERYKKRYGRLPFEKKDADKREA